MGRISSMLRALLGITEPAYTLKPYAVFDFSEWETIPEWSKVTFPDGTKLLITKATDGKDYIDPSFARNFQAFKQFPYPRTAYHFYEPNDIAGQIENYCTHLLDQGWTKNDAPPIVDAEYAPPPEDRKHPDNLPRGAAIAYQIKVLLDGIEARLGVRPIIYSSLYYVQQMGGFPAWGNQYKWWLAWYPDTAYVDKNAVIPASMIPSGLLRDNVVMWQYRTDWRIVGIPWDGVDVSAADPVFLSSIGAPAPEPAPEPPPAPIPTPDPVPTPAPLPESPSYVYARLKHDWQLARWNFKPRDKGVAYIPETFPFEDQPKGSTKGAPVLLSDRWYNWWAQLTAPLHNWVMATNAMIFNHVTNPKLAELISSSGNVVRIDRKQDGHGHVYAFQNDTFIGGPWASYHTHPEYVHKVVCIAPDGTLHNPARNADSYYAPVGNPDLWVNLADVEEFPTLPIQVKVNLLTLPWLNVRDAPYGQVVKHILPGQSVWVFEYAPKESDVWGHVQFDDGSQGWIALLSRGKFYTDWKMQTPAPIPPSS